MIRRPPWWPWEDAPTAELPVVERADALAVLELRVEQADKMIEAALMHRGPVSVDVLLDVRLTLRPDLRVKLRPAAPGLDGSRSP